MMLLSDIWNKICGRPSNGFCSSVPTDEPILLGGQIVSRQADLFLCRARAWGDYGRAGTLFGMGYGAMTIQG